MIRNRLVTLIAVAVTFAVPVALAPADARDASLCSGIAPPAAAMKVVPCAKALGGNDAAAAQPVLQGDGGAATDSVITEPVTRTKHFIYRLKRPEEPSGDTIVLLHGSGGDEASLFRLAARIAPNATLLGVRGRVVQKGLNRWYARLSPVEFDQADILKEAHAFAAFLKQRMAAEKLDLDRAVFIGYSNGANLVAALTLVHPGLIHRAVLLRAMPVLHAAPDADLGRSRFLSVPGKVDRVYGPFAPALETLLRDRGAMVDSRMVAGGHYLGDEDIKVVSDWLKQANALAGGATAQ